MQLETKTVLPIFEKLQAYNEPVIINETKTSNILEGGGINISVHATINNAQLATQFLLDNQKILKLPKTYQNKTELIQAVLDTIELCADTVMPDINNGFKIDDESFAIDLI